LAGALEAYDEGLKIMRVLSAKDPLNMEWRRDLQVSLIKQCDAFRTRNDLAGEFAACRESLGIARALRRLRIFGQRDKLKANRSKGA
jgi:hypothetical protein